MDRQAMARAKRRALVYRHCEVPAKCIPRLASVPAFLPGSLDFEVSNFCSDVRVPGL